MEVFGSGEGASLRNHREIVAAAWTDFEARLLDTEVSPMLSALLTFEDGRQFLVGIMESTQRLGILDLNNRPSCCRLYSISVVAQEPALGA